MLFLRVHRGFYNHVDFPELYVLKGVTNTFIGFEIVAFLWPEKQIQDLVLLAGYVKWQAMYDSQHLTGAGRFSVFADSGHSIVWEALWASVYASDPSRITALTVRGQAILASSSYPAFM